MAIYKNNQEVKDIYMVGYGLPDPNAVGLQEDVDYVRYQWLKTNDGAWIDTLIRDFTGVNDLTFHVKKKINGGGSVMGCEGAQNINRLIFDMDYYQKSTNRLTKYVSTTSDTVNGKDFVVHINFVDNKVKINRNTSTYTTVEVPKILRNTCPLFAKKALNGTPRGLSSVQYIEYFKIDNSLNLVPCRLLHSIPASMDANGIARQEGEYGMIDLVSKMFYGNVNNSGSFTGEGLITKKVTFAFFNGKRVYGQIQEGVHIRRYGWLKAVIYRNKTLQTLPINSRVMSYSYRWGETLGNTQLFNTNGYSYFTSSKTNVGVWSDSQQRNVQTIGYIPSLVEIVSTENKLTIGGQAMTQYGYPIKSILFNNSMDIPTVKYNSPISVDNSIRYTPCKLLRPIPPELDANGIARAAGECGMYDEINHKFYGNVANSGAFTVEGMAEGYDYEVYTYLKGTGGCYIDTLINPAWNDQLSATTEVEGQPTVSNPTMIHVFDGTNVRIGLVLDESWYSSNTPQIIAIHRAAGQSDKINYSGFSASAEIYVSLKVTNNAAPTTSCKINGAAWTTGSTSGTNIITALPDTTYKIGRDTSNGLDVLKLKNVKIKSHNFMPCKLLRAIPAELDANGIARNAEECGMVDTYNGLFYGNVNSGGTFSVSDE